MPVSLFISQNLLLLRPIRQTLEHTLESAAKVTFCWIWSISRHLTLSRWRDFGSRSATTNMITGIFLDMDTDIVKGASSFCEAMHAHWFWQRHMWSRSAKTRTVIERIVLDFWSKINISQLWPPCSKPAEILYIMNWKYVFCYPLSEPKVELRFHSLWVNALLFFKQHTQLVPGGQGHFVDKTGLCHYFASIFGPVSL